MYQNLESNREALVELCRRYHVARLDLFGSAASGAFNPATSDLDFLVEFQPMEPAEYADCYFGLADALESLLGRRVDLVTVPSIHNPYFRRSIDSTRRLLYAA